MSYSYCGGGGGYSSGYGAFGSQGYNYSYATLANSVDNENDRMKKRGCGAPSSRRGSDATEKHASQVRHRAENASYASLPSGLTMPRLPMVCNHKCPADQRNDRPLKVYPASSPPNHHQQSSGLPRHATKSASKTPRAPRPASEKTRPGLSSDRPRASFDRPHAERKLHPRQSHESARSTRSVRSTKSRQHRHSRGPSQVSRPASIAPKAYSEPPTRVKEKKKSTLWGCFGG